MKKINQGMEASAYYLKMQILRDILSLNYLKMVVSLSFHCVIIIFYLRGPEEGKLLDKVGKF